jgi:hypothetical protein
VALRMHTLSQQLKAELLPTVTDAAAAPGSKR